MITKGSTLTKPPIRTTMFFVFDYCTSDQHRIYFNQLELGIQLGIFEAATLFIHSTSQLDVWRASTKVSLFVPKVPPKKKQPPKPWNPKSYSPIFFFGQPPPLFLSPPLYFGRRRIFCLKKYIKTHLCRGVSFCPEGPKQPLYFWGGGFRTMPRREKHWSWHVKRPPRGAARGENLRWRWRWWP